MSKWNDHHIQNKERRLSKVRIIARLRRMSSRDPETGRPSEVVACCKIKTPKALANGIVQSNDISPALARGQKSHGARPRLSWRHDPFAAGAMDGAAGVSGGGTACGGFHPHHLAHGLRAVGQPHLGLYALPAGEMIFWAGRAAVPAGKT